MQRHANELEAKKATSAPQWLVDRMEALKKLPPPTLEEVRIQFEASANYRQNPEIWNSSYIH